MFSREKKTLFFVTSLYSFSFLNFIFDKRPSFCIIYSKIEEDYLNNNLFELVNFQIIFNMLSDQVVRERDADLCPCENG